MAKPTTRGYEIRLRLGGGKRLERNIPKTLTQTQADAREKLIIELDRLLRAAGDPKSAHIMLSDLATAPTVDEGAKLEKAIRRFAREQAGRGSAAPQPHLVTFREFGMRWASGKLAEQYPRYVRVPSESHSKNNRSRVLKLSETIGDIPLVLFTHEDAKRALAAAVGDDLSTTTYRHFAQVIQTIVRKAVEPCGLIKVEKYPLPWKGFLPPIDAPPSFPILFPKEDALLLGATDVPPWRRVLYGFAVREGVRVSHMFRLKWGNVDFENGQITVGKGKNNPDARTWDLNAGVAKVLYQFRGQAKARDFIFPRLDADEIIELAEGLRSDLKLAGCDRRDLFASGDGQEPIRFQDLRATFVSLHLAMGWSEVDVMLRTQHTSTTVLHHRYARRLALAKSIVKRQGPLLPLDRVLKGGGSSWGSIQGN